LPDAEHLTGVTEERIRAVLAANGAESEVSAVRASVPDWLWARAGAELGEAWPATMAVLNTRAPFFLRANPVRATVAKLREQLREEGIETAPVAGLPEALQVTGSREVFRTEPFLNGWFEVQDANSQRVAPLLEVEPGMRVVDACAGAGGKALHLAALMENRGRIIALDPAPWRLAELRRRAARAGVQNLEARELDDAKVWKRLAGTADRLLLDVPCSGLGVLRRNPDIRWTLTEGELERLNGLQREILGDYAQMVKAGGKMVYSTCSILPSENEGQVGAFLAGHPGWVLEAELRIVPGENGGDGFYAARVAAPGGG
jgi:16S rRNA (cytosine967-C5)-methyltransferase